MNILEALRQTTTSIKTWVDNKFLQKTEIEGLATEDYVDSSVSQKSQVQMITLDASEILPVLKIHELTQEEYDEKVANGTFDEDTLYLTPDEEIDLSQYATIEELNAKADLNHKHEDVNNSITKLNNLVGNTKVSEQISTAIEDTTANDFGIYVQSQEPANADACDIWIDTANEPSYIPSTLPEITEDDNGKILMVVDGNLQLVNLNMSIDANGVVYMQGG